MHKLARPTELLPIEDLSERPLPITERILKQTRFARRQILKKILNSQNRDQK